MEYLRSNTMQADEPSTFNTFITWLDENWRFIGGFALASQIVDRFFKWLTKRSEARIKEIYTEQYKSTVEPKIDALTASIDGLKESIWELKNKIK